MRTKALRTALLVTALLQVPLLSAGHATTKVRSLSIHGNTAFSTREILEWISVQPESDVNTSVLHRAAETIRDRYSAEGFLACSVAPSMLDLSDDSSFATIVFDIAEGTRSVVGDILWIGNNAIRSTTLSTESLLSSGDPFRRSSVEEALESVLKRYETDGYPFASCELLRLEERTSENENFVDITVRVEEGQLMTIDEVLVEGNTSTKSDVVVREARLTPGELFDLEKAQKFRSRLQRLGIFAEVSDPQLFLRREKGGLLVRVREGNTNTFDGVVGYIPGSLAGEDGYVTGLVSVSMRNLFGTGRKMSFRWQREDRFSQELGFRYLEPWIFGLPANLGGGFFQRQQDTSYVRRAIDLKGDFLFSEEISFGVLFSSASVIPSSDSLNQRVFRSSAVAFGGEVDFDTRNEPVSPTEGVHARADYQFGRKSVTVPPPFVSLVKERSDLQRITIDLEYYLGVFTRQVIALSWHGREIQGGFIEESEMFRVGGASTLRGYRENQFLGSQVFWSNLEYRLLIAPRSFVYAFFDAGYYRRPGDDIRGIAKAESVPYGYGIGIQLETGLGIAGISFALGKGDSFSNGKIHFRLVNDF